MATRNMAVGNVALAARGELADPGDDGYREVIRAFAELAGVSQRAGEIDELLHLVARKICELLEVSRASVYLRDERGRFRGHVGHDVTDIDARVKRLVAGVEGDRFTRDILASKRPVAVSNALDDPRPIRSTMREWGVVSMLGIPMVIADEVIGILFVDDAEHARFFSARACEIGMAFAELAAVAIEQARASTTLRTSMRTVVRENQRLRRAAELERRLAELVAGGVSVLGLVEALAEVLGRPVCFHDLVGNRRALARPTGEEMVPRLLDATYRSHAAVREALAAAGRDATVVAPILAAGLGHRHLLVPVVSGDVLHGHLVALETGNMLSSLDTQLATRAAQILASELSAEERAAGAECDVRASLAGDLLRGDRDIEALRRRSQLVGVDLDRPHVLCLVSATDVTPPLHAAVTKALAALGCTEPVLATPLARGTAAILALDVERSAGGARAALTEFESRLREALAGVHKQSGIVVALSSPTSCPADYTRAADEAGQVLTCVERLGSADGPWLLSADDLGAGRLMLATANVGEVERFARDALGALLVDEEPMRDLLATLQVFFEVSRSVRASAAALEVHENTVRYRLARIHELTGLDVGSDADHQLTAQIALRVLQLQGRRPWSLVGDYAGSTGSSLRSEFQAAVTAGGAW
jgi:sugar diacid utilization regulator